MRILRTIVSFILLGAIFIALYFFKDKIQFDNIAHLLEGWGIWAPIVFMGIYIIAVVLLLPGSVMTIVGGFLFGPLWGTLYNLTAATIGATIAFLIARFVASSWVEQKTGGKLKILKEGVEKEGWKFIAVVRLIPLFPFTLLNYALGLTKVSLKAYIVGSFVFMFPGCLAYTYIGYLGDAVISEEGRSLVGKVFIGVGLLVMVMVIPWIVKTLRKR